LALFDMVEQYGGYVALDATESGPRSFCRAFDRPRLADEPFLELIDAYFDGIQDIARRPNDGFYESLAPRLRERRIGAIILQRCLWCDLWHAEVERFRQCFGVPVLDLDLDGEEPFDTARMRTRVGAFMEMLT
jgi:benzoyl-CoA reductase/2-hydroxyglutaryl-CoA dehydratase subunit BcrC/BadD/HgdB